MALSRHPEVDFSGVDVPRHLDEQMLSHFPRAGSGNSLALDLGCGSAGHRAVCEHAGFGYVGLDFSSYSASLWGDAHALPFRDGSFEFMLSVAVIEHLRFPFVALQEAYRVLKKGGRLVGTAAFLEPAHGNSLYHCTHLGLLNLLRYGGFRVEHVGPFTGWTVLSAQVSNALFPGLPLSWGKVVVWPLQMLHRAWWRLLRSRKAEFDENTRFRISAGAFAFVAHKD